MKKQIDISGFPITVVFSSHACSIHNDKYLRQLLSQKINHNTAALADTFYREFYQIYQRELSVRKKSFIIEIWGHVYCDYFTQRLCKIIHTKWAKAFATKISGYCAQIDIGEKPYDKNRFFWDAIAWTKPAVQLILPRLKVQE